MYKDVKVVVIGDTGVGKTCIAKRLIENAFDPSAFSTLSSSFMRKKVCDKTLQIWDTAGQERFRALAPLYYKNAHAVVLTFDLTRRETLSSLQYWLEDL